MRIVAVCYVLHLLPEVRHCGIGVVAAHGPDGIGVGTRKEDVLRRVRCVKGQDAVVLEENDRLGGDVVGCLALLGGVELDVFLGIEIGIFVEETQAELGAQHILHGTLQNLRLD